MTRERSRALAIVVALAVSSFSCTKSTQSDQPAKEEPVTGAPELLEQGDAYMRAGRPGEALKTYQSAWSALRDNLTDPQRVWLLLSIANAAVRHADYEEAYDALSAIQEHYVDTGIVAGNPLFHLLDGLTYHGLDEEPDGATDGFARALICGGPEMFAGEDSAHLKRMKDLLRPPAELGTWVGYEGCSRDLLNGAEGYLRELLTKKIGKPPPYRYEE